MTPVEQFCAELSAVQGEARLAADPAALAGHLREILAAHAIGRLAHWQHPALAALGLLAAADAAGVERLAVGPEPTDQRLLATAAAGLTHSDLAIAETGSIVLFSRPDQELTVSLLPLVHIAVVPAAAIVADVPAATAHLGRLVREDPAGLHTIHFITGPSRSADIEMTMTRGVHGPQFVYALVYTGDPAAQAAGT